MANDNVIGLSMQLDVTDLKSGIKEVNSVIKKSKEEFNNATAGMDKWTGSSEGLNAKLKQLNTQLDAQNKAVKGYEAEIKRVSELEGDHSVQLEQLKSKLAKAQAEVKKTEQATKHYKNTLSEVTKKEKEENSSLGKLQKTITEQKNKVDDLTKEYKNAVLQYGKNSSEAKALSKQLTAVSKELEKNEEKVRSADKAFEGLGKSIGDSATKALEKSVKTFAKVGAAVGGLVGSFLATAEATREFRTNMAKVETAFSEAGYSAKDAEKTYTEFYGILGDEGQATEAVSHLAKLSNSQEDLAKWTDIAAGVYGTFGDSLPIENLTEAANETAKTGELTGGLADALNWAGISEDKFQDKLDACNNEQERQALIQTTLTKAYSGASAKYKETNADVIASQEAQAKLSQAMADVGAQAEPLLTELKLMGAELAEKMLPVIENVVNFTKDNMPLVVGVVGTLTTAIGVLGAAVLATKVKTAALTVAQIAQKTAMIATTAATNGLAVAMKLLNAVMKANPIGLVITAITLLVTAFVTLWKKSEAFQKFWKSLWDGIKKITKTVADAIGKFLTGAWDVIKKVWSKAKDYFSNLGSEIVDAFKALPEKLKAVFANAWKLIKSAFTNPKEFFTNYKNLILSVFDLLPDSFGKIGKSIVEGLWKGIGNAKDWIIGKLKGFADSVIGGIKDFFGVHSPSTVTAEIGGYMADGLVEGIEEGADKVLDASTKVGENFVKGVEQGSKESNFDYFDNLNDTIEKQKNKLARLEKQYKSAVATFGETSDEAYKFGRQIMSLTREIDANELKVKDLNDGYKNLSGTLANQMRVELNQAQNKMKSLEEQYKSLGEAMTKAMKSGARHEDINGIIADQIKLNTEYQKQKSVVKELTSNLDYMAKKQEEQTTVAQVVRNEYEKLTDTIKEQETELNSLKTQYASAVMTFGESSDEAKNLGAKIKTVSNELANNKNKVEELDRAYKNLIGDVEQFPEIEVEVEIKRNKFELFLENSKAKLEEWRNGVGSIISSIGDIAEKTFAKITEFTDAMFDLYNSKADAKIAKIEKELDTVTKGYNEELSTVEKTANAELELIRQQFHEQKISAVDYKNKKMKIEDELAKQTSKLNKQKQAEEERLAREKDTIARKQFEANKRNSIAQAVIQGALAIVKGFAELGPVAGAVAAVAQGAITAAQVAAISNQEYIPAFAKGGIVDGATLAVIGENGKEAVMPLENNTGWIKQLAEQISNIMSKDLLNGLQLQPAYAMAGGDTVINNYYNQTINSPKQLTRREIYRDSKNLLSLKG